MLSRTGSARRGGGSRSCRRGPAGRRRRRAGWRGGRPSGCRPGPWGSRGSATRRSRVLADEPLDGLVERQAVGRPFFLGPAGDGQRPVQGGLGDRQGGRQGDPPRGGGTEALPRPRDRRRGRAGPRARRPPKVASAVPGWLPIAPPPAPGVGPSRVLAGTAPAAAPARAGLPAPGHGPRPRGAGPTRTPGSRIGDCRVIYVSIHAPEKPGDSSSQYGKIGICGKIRCHENHSGPIAHEARLMKRAASRAAGT